MLRLPRLEDFDQVEADGQLDFRPIAIEDLLCRPRVAFKQEATDQLIEGRCVLVTGAGGSIGSELCRQISFRRPGKLLLLDANEFSL